MPSRKPSAKPDYRNRETKSSMASKSSKAKNSTQRKLTAILCADVVGYSRLMGADEEATIETLTAYRKVFVFKIKKHRGRVVDAKGDAILAEFASVVDAVNGAVEIQRELAGQNTALSDERRMDCRKDDMNVECVRGSLNGLLERGPRLLKAT